MHDFETKRSLKILHAVMDRDPPSSQTIENGVSYAPCMDGSKCTKYYSKTFSNETTIEKNRFVKYRRRDDRRKATIRGMNIDNR